MRGILNTSGTFIKKQNWKNVLQVSGSRGVEYEDGCLLGLPTFLLDDGAKKHLWNVGKLLPDYTAQQPRRQPSSNVVHFGEHFFQMNSIQIWPT
jgi:hypothetical protein